MLLKATIGICLIAMSNTSFAETKIEDQIKFRQSGMMFMRWNMGNIKEQVVTKPNTYNKERVLAAANTIAAVANSGIFDLFTPETKTGKGWKKTRLKNDFFLQPDEVKNRINDFTKEVGKFVQVSNSGNIEQIKDQFESLFKACKSCHKKFRSKE